MGRKRGMAGGNAVNPLQRMLGAYLRVERTKNGDTSAEIARRLGLTDTYYRLVEAGKATLNQGLAIQLMLAFDHSGPGRRQIVFSQVCMFLVAINLVGAEMAAFDDEDNHEDPGKRAIEELTGSVAGFDDLFQRTAGYFDKEEGSPDQRRYLEEVVAPELANFLTRDPAAGSSVDGATSMPLSLDETPTLNIDAILDINRILSWRPFVHTPQFASEWEKAKAKDFRSLKAIYSDSKIIINEENLSDFQYPYLTSPSFHHFQAIFPNESGLTTPKQAEARAAKLKEEFVDGLNKLRRNSKYGALSRGDTDKIVFLCLTAAERQSSAKSLSGILNLSGDNSTAYWSFTTVDYFPIAFQGRMLNAHLHPTEVATENLNLSDAKKKERQFDEFWASIQQSREDKGDADRTSRRRPK
jgi:transcriptional regulator with XRE-family HTH domain